MMLRFWNRLVLITFVLQGTLAGAYEILTVNLDPLIIETSRLDGQFERDLLPTNESALSALSELGNAISGVFLFEQAGLAGNTEVIVRGAEPNFTKFYIEGIEVNDSTDTRGGSFQPNHFSWSSWQSVHVLKGNFSPIHGTDAIGGIMAFEFNEGDEASSMIQVGDYGYLKTTLNTGFNRPDLRGRASISYAQEDGLYEGSDFENLNGYFKGSWDIAPGRQLKVAFWAADTEKMRYPDDSGGPLFAASDALDHLQNTELGLSLRLTTDQGGPLSWQALAGFYHNDSEQISPGVSPGLRDPFGVPASEFQNDFWRFQMRGDLTYRFNDEVQMAWGVSLKEETADSQGVLKLPFADIPSPYEDSRSTVETYGEAQFQLFDVSELQLALQIEKISDLDAQLNPSIQYTIPLLDMTELSFRYSEGFKAPSLFALNSPLVGNPDLAPETVRAYEARLSQAFLEDRLLVSVTYFDQRYRDLIDFSETTQRLINLSRVTTHGFEFEAQWQFNNQLRVSGNLAHLNLDIPGSDELLRNRPELLSGLNLIYESVQGYRVNIHYQYVGERGESSIPTGDIRLAGFHRVNVYADYQVMDNHRVGLRLRNLLNDQENTLLGYEEPGIQVLGVWEWNW